MLQGDLEYRAALGAVRDMLERAGSARAVEAAELRANRLSVLTLLARQRSVVAGLRGFEAAVSGATLSPMLEELIERLGADAVAEIVGAPTAIVATREGVAAA